ncbi:MAG: hypothetical protein B6D55_06140 [Candidatus Omnitrophica bacterium 4484_70.2]|nr:MAG: hypothetical protein B6D55_06140 [Candidatus Omnitrophica bacterium 4484_70.2]
MNFILKTFLNATYFIADKMMPNGRTLYIGRGQEQIFGYSTLLYSLELAQLFLKKNFFEKKITKLLKLLTHFQRKDGSFPLVLNENEKNLSFHQTLSSKALPGWYLYNTIFDYLPFAGVYLFESYRISQNENNNSGKKESFPGMKKEKNSEIVKGKTPTYEFCYAIPTSGKGYYSDELPIPFIVSKEKKDITPIYGGDPYLEKIITPELIPLPYGTLEKSNFKQHLIYWLQFKANLKFSHWGYHLYYSKLRKKDILPFFFANQLRYKKIYNGFSGTNLFITHTRKFNFLKKEITVFDKIVLKRKISFNEFYIINLFVFPGEILRGKNSLIIENTKFTLKIEPIEGDVEFKEQISPLGKLLWIKEKIKQNNKESIYNRKITIILK